MLSNFCAASNDERLARCKRHLEKRYDAPLAAYLAAGFKTRQLSNTTNTLTNAIEQTQTLAPLCVGAP